MLNRTFCGVAGGLVTNALAFDSVLLGGKGEADMVGAYEGTEWRGCCGQDCLTLTEGYVLEAAGC